MSTGFCAASAKRMAFIYDLFVFGGLISEIVRSPEWPHFEVQGELPVAIRGGLTVTCSAQTRCANNYVHKKILPVAFAKVVLNAIENRGGRGVERCGAG